MHCPGVRAPIAVLFLGVQVSACTSWRVDPTIVPERLVVLEHPRSVQVRERGGARYVVEAPKIVNDSLVGMVAASRSSAEYLVGGAQLGGLTKRTIPLTVVDRIATRRVSVGKTVALAFLLGLVVKGVSAGRELATCCFGAR